MSFRFPIVISAGDYWAMARTSVFFEFNAGIFGIEHSVTLTDILIDVSFRQHP
jgi:hypothetical protein